ncbi:hypothetical protein SLE2022_131180 [Rubroshorea leprosula]
MGSRREEERKEKIIRGLMKLPPNRKCINCNSLVPQYVCTDFWTFVCMTCSGIHREFTHRVKSVSMSKFSSQEVEALQNGGNQRAREIYLKDWDMQTQRLPSSSNADKIREFIKNVYVDRRYAGGKSSNNPPRDMQGLNNHEDDTRRASSYHSFSQSPPYDYQYEDRRYGRQVGALSRKPGSDRGYYVGRFSSFIGSPGCLSDQTFEDRFANEGSAPRASNYSISSGGDTFRPGTESPSFQKDIGFSSPSIQSSREGLGEDARHQTIDLFADPIPKRDAQLIPHIQRTISPTSTGSFDSNSTSFESYNTGNVVDISEPHQTAGVNRYTASTFPQSSGPVNYGGLDLFNTPESSAPPPTDLFQPATPSVPSTSSTSTGSYDSNSTSFKLYNTGNVVDVSEPHQTAGANQDTASTFPRSSAPVNYGGLDLFNTPESSVPPPTDLFLLETSLVPSTEMFQRPADVATSLHQLPQNTPSVDLFSQIVEQSPTANLGVESSELSIPKNEGWATFDTQPAASNSNPGMEIHSLAKMPSNGDFAVNFDQFSSLKTSMPGPLLEGSGAASSLSSPWQEGLYNVQAQTVVTSTQAWNAFEDSVEHIFLEDARQKQSSETEVLAYKPSVTANRSSGIGVSEDSNNDGIQGAAHHPGTFAPNLPSDFAMAPFAPPSMLPIMGEKQLHGSDHKSTNPFDHPYDSDMEPSNMFFDMSSLQAVLPNPELSSTFVAGKSEPWFPQNPVTTFIAAAAPQGGLAYVAGQPQSSQLLNISTQGPVASIGGNPFA